MMYFKFTKDYKGDGVNYQVYTVINLAEYAYEKDHVVMSIRERAPRKKNWEPKNLTQREPTHYKDSYQRVAEIHAANQERETKAVQEFIPTALDDAKKMLIDRINKLG